MSADPQRTLRVACGDGAVMAIPNPVADPTIEWCMRYGDAQEGRFVAAEMLAAYDYLLSEHIPMTEATRRLRLMRKARREAIALEKEVKRAPSRLGLVRACVDRLANGGSTDEAVWRPADPDKANECERLFQNGGPKVYTRWREGSREFLPASLSATRVARSLGPGESVYARRKVGGKYVWMCMARASSAKATGEAA